jgi:hypothetical protein
MREVMNIKKKDYIKSHLLLSFLFVMEKKPSVIFCNEKYKNAEKCK